MQPPRLPAALTSSSSAPMPPSPARATCVEAGGRAHPGRLRPVPGLQAPAPAQLGAVPGRPGLDRRRGADPRAPRPQRLPAAAGPLGLPRPRLVHARPRASLCGILLPDSGRLLEEEAGYANRNGSSKHHPARTAVQRGRCARSLRQLQGVPLRQDFEPVPGVRRDASRMQGHILGAAAVTLECEGTRITLQRRPRPPARSGDARARAAGRLRLARGRIHLRRPRCIPPRRLEQELREVLQPRRCARRRGGDSGVRRRPRAVAAACHRATAATRAACPTCRCTSTARWRPT